MTRSPSTRAPRRARAIGVAITIAGTSASLAACVTPPPPPTGSPDLVVFDIDGTLTDDELSNGVHPDAATAVNAYVSKGYNVVYVTARWSALRSSTEDWLSSNGFPSLPLYMPGSLLVSDQSKIDYKTSTLQTLEAGTPEVVYAYGDSSTDFVAYANVGVPTAHVFALQRASASSCQTGVYAICMPNYTAHIPYIQALPPAT